MPCEIHSMIKMEMQRGQTCANLLVALKNGEIRTYNDKNLIIKLQVDDVINGMCFGVFGREEGCLVFNTKSGSIQARILQRQAKLKATAIKPGPPPEQDIPLKVP